MNDRDHVSEEELNAYVDNELPADRRGVVEAWLSTHPEDAARVAAWHKQAELLCHRYGHLEYETPPPRFDLYATRAGRGFEPCIRASLPRR